MDGVGLRGPKLPRKVGALGKACGWGRLASTDQPLQPLWGGALQQTDWRVWGPGHLKNISRHLKSYKDTWLCLGPDRARFLVGFGLFSCGAQGARRGK